MNKIYLIAGILMVGLLLAACNRKAGLSSDSNTAEMRNKNLEKEFKGEPEKSIEPSAEEVKIGDDIKTVPIRSPFNEEPDTVFLIRRTACYGTCPQYTALVLSNGKAIYQGKRYVDKIGNYTANVNKKKIFELDGRIQAADFYNFEDEYPTNGQKIADASNTILFSEYQNKRKSIYINYDAPPELLELAEEMDQFFEGLKWQAAEVLD